MKTVHIIIKVVKLLWVADSITLLKFFFYILRQYFRLIKKQKILFFFSKNLTFVHIFCTKKSAKDAFLNQLNKSNKFENQKYVLESSTFCDTIRSKIKKIHVPSFDIAAKAKKNKIIILETNAKF